MKNLLEKIKNGNYLTGLLIVKMALIVAIFVVIQNRFYIGDVPLSASEEEAKKEEVKKDETKKEDKVVDEKKQEPSQEPSQEVAKGEKDGDNKTTDKKEANEEKPKRKSFLEDLLNLPVLEPEKVQKDELGRYLSLAEKKKRQIDDRLETLKFREEQLIKLEKSIEEKLAQLEEERLFFSQTIQKEKEIQSTRLDKLVEFFLKMEPKKAAAIFEKMDKDLIVSLFKKLPQKQITAILESVTPARSVELSEYFGRIRSAREYDLLKEMNQSLRKEFSECKGMPVEVAENETTTEAAKETKAH